MALQGGVGDSRRAGARCPEPGVQRQGWLGSRLGPRQGAQRGRCCRRGGTPERGGRSRAAGGGDRTELPAVPVGGARGGVHSPEASAGCPARRSMTAPLAGLRWGLGPGWLLRLKRCRSELGSRSSGPGAAPSSRRAPPRRLPAPAPPRFGTPALPRPAHPPTPALNRPALPPGVPCTACAPLEPQLCSLPPLPELPAAIPPRSSTSLGARLPSRAESGAVLGLSCRE